MSQSDNFHYEITNDLHPEAVWEIVTHPKKWWVGLYNEQIEGKCESVGDEFTFRAGDGMHYSKQRLSKIEKQRLIEWEIVKSKLTFLENPAEWTGTHIRFEIFPEESGSKIVFTHEGLTPGIECYDSCSNAWKMYMNRLDKLTREY